MNRALNHIDGKQPSQQRDYDFCSVVYYTLLGTPVIFVRDDNGAFTNIYEPSEYDWYVIVAIEKLNKITSDRNLITYSLLMQYRGAIREVYQKQLDRTLNRKYDHPSNRNTIKSVISYIERMTANIQ